MTLFATTRPRFSPMPSTSRLRQRVAGGTSGSGSGSRYTSPSRLSVGERLDVVGPDVEGVAAGQFEAGVVPVTRQQAVVDGSLREGKAHVGTAVVDGVNLVFVVKQCDCTPACRDDVAPRLA